MNEREDLIRTIQFQQNQINQLKSQLGRLQTINFQQKYKKALKEISGIITANRQLKQELDKLKNFRGGQTQTVNQIQKEQFNKTFQKMLKQKNQLYSEKEAMELENQKLRYNIADLEETVNNLKNDKMNLAMENEASQRYQEITMDREAFGKKIQKGHGTTVKDREAELKKTIEMSEAHHVSLSRENRKLEERANQLENNLFNLETEYKNIISEKEAEIKQTKVGLRDEYQGQISNLKRENKELKILNGELEMKIKYYHHEQENKYNAEDEYEKEFIQTLRDLKSQMEPMSSQIKDLQSKNEYEKEESLRQKTNLQLKVVEIESQLDRYRENHKILEQKLVKELERNRKFEEAEKTIRKLEEENRMLGGRVIVLESKEVALRNRSGDELEERVMEFQTRVEMLLNDKEAIGNTKNIGIHQLIALKAYIMELDGKLKQVVNENEYAIKKYKSYKQKSLSLIKQLRQHDIAINSLKGKLQGYDRLVVKLQGELERAISINENQFQDYNSKVHETLMAKIEIYKKKYEVMNERFNFEEKYTQQELETVKLNYETKMVDLKLKIEELEQLKETIALYKAKNEELSAKLSEKQNELLESRMTKVNIREVAPQPKVINKEITQRLNETITAKEAEIMRLESQVKNLETEWRTKFSQLEQTTSSNITKKNKLIEDHEHELGDLASQLKILKKSHADLENKLFVMQNKESVNLEETVELRKYQNINSKFSDMEIEMETIQHKYEIEFARANKLAKVNTELNESKNEMEGEISKLKFELKKVEKEMQMELEEKDAEIRRVKLRIRESDEEVSPMNKTGQIENYKINSLKMDLEMLESQNKQLEVDKNRYYNRTIELEREVSSFSLQIDELNYSLERAKSAATSEAMLYQTEKDQEIETLQYQLRNAQSRLRDSEEEIANRENELVRIKSEYGREKQRLTDELDIKSEEISKISRDLSRIKFEFSAQEDSQSSVRNELEYKMNKIQQENSALKDEIENIRNERNRYEAEARFLKNREEEMHDNLNNQEDYVVKLSNEIKNFQNKEVQMEGELYSREDQITKLNAEISYIRSEIMSIQETIDSKDELIKKLNGDLSVYKTEQMQWEIEIGSKDTTISKLQSDLSMIRNSYSNLEEDYDNSQREISRLKQNKNIFEEQSEGYQNQLQEKQSLVFRLQGDLKNKNDYINELSEEIDSKNAKIAELQGETARYRSISTDFESEIFEKSTIVNRLNFELNSLKSKYEDLENEHESKSNNWQTLNREIAAFKAQIQNFQGEIELKDSAIERYKREIKELSRQIENLHDEIFQKNTQINQLNQEIFKLKMEGEEKSTEQIFSLENQIFRLKSKVTNLESELEMKEDELTRAKSEIVAVRSSYVPNRYSDDEYDLLQNQFYQVQKSLTDARGQLSDKDLEISQLEGKVEFMTRNESSLKRRLQQDTEQLEQELQSAMVRERELRLRISEIEEKEMLRTNSDKELKDKEWGLHLYTEEVDRLNSIVLELQEQVTSLRLKLSELNNQEDRIVENLTIMTLTFAEVDALRDRMKAKEEEISEVRKSLVNFAGSMEEIKRQSTTPRNTDQFIPTNKSITLEEENLYNVSLTQEKKEKRENLEVHHQNQTIQNTNFHTITQNLQTTSSYGSSSMPHAYSEDIRPVEGIEEENIEENQSVVVERNFEKNNNEEEVVISGEIPLGANKDMKQSVHQSNQGIVTSSHHTNSQMQRSSNSQAQRSSNQGTGNSQQIILNSQGMAGIQIQTGQNRQIIVQHPAQQMFQHQGPGIQGQVMQGQGIQIQTRQGPMHQSGHQFQMINQPFQQQQTVVGPARMMGGSGIHASFDHNRSHSPQMGGQVGFSQPMMIQRTNVPHPAYPMNMTR